MCNVHVICMYYIPSITIQIKEVKQYYLYMKGSQQIVNLFSSQCNEQHLSHSRQSKAHFDENWNNYVFVISEMCAAENFVLFFHIQSIEYKAIAPILNQDQRDEIVRHTKNINQLTRMICIERQFAKFLVHLKTRNRISAKVFVVTQFIEWPTVWSDCCLVQTIRVTWMTILLSVCRRVHAK